MWTCAVCKSDVDDDTWENCWKCATPRGLAGQALAEQELKYGERLAALKCLRCDTPLESVGTKKFRVGGMEGWWSEFGQFFESRMALDVYCCKQCGKVELRVSG